MYYVDTAIITSQENIGSDITQITTLLKERIRELFKEANDLKGINLNHIWKLYHKKYREFPRATDYNKSKKIKLFSLIEDVCYIEKKKKKKYVKLRKQNLENSLSGNIIKVGYVLKKFISYGYLSQ